MNTLFDLDAPEDLRSEAAREAELSALTTILRNCHDGASGVLLDHECPHWREDVKELERRGLAVQVDYVERHWAVVRMR